MKKVLLLFSIIIIITHISCEKDEDFAYDINNLIGTEWGYPEIEEGSADYIEPTPTVFHEDGRVTFGGTINDFWQIKDSRSILIQQRSEIWHIMQLTENKMYVEKLRYPNGKFLVRCTYYPVQEN
jgi:hypothetical protein